ncbi:uncharacterized protein LOC9642587 [Selaginella moellendorffii]|nr:uncharacterized protein LOC9642587 [Selaginella moellendorffii]|eukprot:XP_002973676.2 uncharacterized protein LOC9642587 [Selaginella moellendorffii]
MDASCSASWVSGRIQSFSRITPRASSSDQNGPQSAMERAAAYRKKMEEMKIKKSKEEEKRSLSSNEVEVEIITRDGVIKRRAPRPQDSLTLEIRKKGMEFVGLDFSEKKKPGRPAGLIAEFEAPPPGQLPEVEIITRDVEDASKSGDDLYKPKVSTWGVFPRPPNISKTFGGGRTIKPGEELETDEEKKAREAKTKELLAEYRRKMGLDIDPRVSSECQEIMSKAEGLLKSGKLRDAVQNFEIVMEKMVFQSELHGQAALSKALCLESMNRSREARVIYDKLVSHSSQSVKKRAKQLIFSFEAAEKLKVSENSTWDVNAYRDYFELIPRKYTRYNSSYTKPSSEEGEDDQKAAFREGLFYFALTLAPVILVFVVAILKRNGH